MACDRFEEFEDVLHKEFDQIQLDFKSTVILVVKVLRCRDISVSLFHDTLLDTPDPQVVITCPTLKEPNTFKTETKQDSPTCEINETFQFSIPSDVKETDAFPVIIEVYDVDTLYDDFIGKKTLDVSDLNLNETWLRTINFDEHGEVDLEIMKTLRKTPDFRFSLSLVDEEKRFRKKRIPFVLESLKNILDVEKAPRSLSETPVMSLVGSGGGYRAIIGMCGAMEALKDANLLDAFTYTCGLSGSSWYISTAYALKGAKAEEQAAFHEHIKESLGEKLILDFLNPAQQMRFRSHIREKKRCDQPSSFVDFFGFCLGCRLLGSENLSAVLSDLKPYVEHGDVPFPLLVSLHVRNSVKASKYHAYMEFSPYEVNIPTHGIGISTQDVGSSWTSGFLARRSPELPLHFIQGTLGCAFSILLKSYVQKGGEKCENLMRYIDDIRRSVRGSHAEDDSDEEAMTFDSDDSGDEESEDLILEENDAAADPKVEEMEEKSQESSGKSNWDMLKIMWRAIFGTNQSETDSKSTNSDRQSSNIDPHALHDGMRDQILDDPATEPEAETTFQSSTVRERMRERMVNSSFFQSRSAIIGRTAKFHNVVHGMDDVPTFPMNPLSERTPDAKLTEQQRNLLKIPEIRVNGKMLTRKRVISVVDAGVLKNVPTDIVLRPQRDNDLLLVFDFTLYGSDSEFDYNPLLAAGAHSWRHNLKFPSFNFEDIIKLPSKELIVLEGDDDDTPTVLWFTLCNRKFRKLENYKPRFSTEFSTGNSFNDFPVYDPGNAYSTFKFHYTEEEFDRLRDLMYYNVTSHIEEVKYYIAKAVERKRKRVAASSVAM